MTTLQQAGSSTFEFDGERYRYYSIPAVARLRALPGSSGCRGRSY